MIDLIRQEIVSTLALTVIACIFYGTKMLRDVALSYLAAKSSATVVAAVTRAAGLAMEMQRAGADASSAVQAGVTYVEQAIPAALAKTGAAGHLPLMIEGQIGVLRAGAPQNTAAPGAGAPLAPSATPAGREGAENPQSRPDGLPVGGF